MRPTLVLVQKSLLLFFQNKAAVSITFLVPVVMIYLFGHVFGLYRKESGPSGIRIAVINESADPAAASLIEALRKEKAFRVITDAEGTNGAGRHPLSEAEVRTALHQNDYHYALIIPKDVVSPDHIGVRLKFLFDPRNDIESQMVNGLLQKTIFMNVPQLLGRSLQMKAEATVGKDAFHQFDHELAGLVASRFGGDAKEIEAKMNAGDFGFGLTQSSSSASAGNSAKEGNGSTAEDFVSRLFDFQKEQVSGKTVSNPMAARLVGGYAIMFLLFAVSASATAMFEEKRSGIYQRILSAPVRPAHIVWSRFLFGVVLGLIQITALFLAGRVFYHLDIFSHIGTLFVLTIAAAAACTSFGMLLAAIAPSGEAVQGMATLIIMTMSAIGGAWFPVSFMPEFIQKFSKLTIVYWSVEGFTSVLWAGQTFMEVLPTIGILAGIALGVMLLATFLFKRGSMFE